MNISERQKDFLSVIENWIFRQHNLRMLKANMKPLLRS